MSATLLTPLRSQNRARQRPQRQSVAPLIEGHDSGAAQADVVLQREPGSRHLTRTLARPARSRVGKVLK